MRDTGGDAADGFELLTLRELAHEAARFGHVDHEAAQEAHVVDELAGHRPAQLHHFVVGRDHRAQRLESAGHTFVELLARARFALARQQRVEEAGFLPARLRNPEHGLRLRTDVGEAAVREIELERNRARGFGDQAVLLAAARELGRAFIDVRADGFVGERERRGVHAELLHGLQALLHGEQEHEEFADRPDALVDDAPPGGGADHIGVGQQRDAHHGIGDRGERGRERARASRDRTRGTRATRTCGTGLRSGLRAAT